MHVLGEIKNESDGAVQNVIIKASFYDQQGNLLNEFQRSPELRVINPGETSPFEILYLESNSVDDVKNFTLSATGDNTEMQKKDLKITITSSRLDLLGTYYINGIIQNDGQETATNSIAIATLYDADGRVIAIGKALAEADDITSNVPAFSEAAFGIAITEKLQTYKAKSFSLVADSDQYQSMSSQYLAGNQSTNQSGCLIATAAFGSELAPQVQKLRQFRDGIVLGTSAGSSFMNVFNAWYYSFSPSVADYERQLPWLRDSVKFSTYPLIGILEASTLVHDAVSINDEVGVVFSGLVAGSMIGAVYFFPLTTGLVFVLKRKQLELRKLKQVLAILWAGGLALIILAELFAMPEIMMFATSFLVLLAISTTILAIAMAAKKFFPVRLAKL